jgi:hypothetical protein
VIAIELRWILNVPLLRLLSFIYFIAKISSGRLWILNTKSQGVLLSLFKWVERWSILLIDFALRLFEFLMHEAKQLLLSLLNDIDGFFDVHIHTLSPHVVVKTCVGLIK